MQTPPPYNNLPVPTGSPNLPAESSSMGLMAQARQAAASGNTNAAINYLEQMLHIDSQNIDALWLYAQVHPDTDRTMKALNRILAINPNHFEARMFLERIQTTRASAPDDSSQVNRMLQQMMMQQQMLLQQQLANQMQQQPQQQPININVANNTQNQQVQYGAGYGMMGLIPQQNGAAFWVGFLAAFFLGFFGIAHMMTGRVTTGIGYLLLGWFIWAPIFFFTALLIFPLLVTIPLHIAFAYQNARDGSIVYVPAAYAAPYPYQRF